MIELRDTHLHLYQRLSRLTTDVQLFARLPVREISGSRQIQSFGAAAALLSFAAYPSVKQMQQRQLATDAFLAWICRRAREQGLKISPSTRLKRKNLPTEYVQRRVFKAARRFEFEALDIVHIGMELSFRRSGGYEDLARLFAGAMGATSVSISFPRYFHDEASLIRSYLRRVKSKSALADEVQRIRDFRRRVWRPYLPALPLLTALHMDVLKFDAHVGQHKIQLPGHGRRYLAISLLHNPAVWVPSIVSSTQIRAWMMKDHFGLNSFAEILGEVD